MPVFLWRTPRPPALSNKQISDSETAVAKALLPTTLDTGVEKDTLTVSGEPTGLTGVYLHRAAVALAEEVADLVLKALPNAAASPGRRSPCCRSPGRRSLRCRSPDRQSPQRRTSCRPASA